MLLWHNAYGANFGDELGPLIVSRLLGGPVPNHELTRDGGRGPMQGPCCVLGLGSIVALARPGDVIWGTGANPNHQDSIPFLGNLDVRAWRGPKTGYYMERRYNIKDPGVYGDPALLLPSVLPEKPQPTRPYGIVPHYHDLLSVCRMPNVIWPTLGWRRVVSFILSSEFIISSSLHGLIVAEAYGIPACWWHSHELLSCAATGRFKYNDYLLSTGRSENQYVEDLQYAIEARPALPPIKFDPTPLRDAFPSEIFQGETDGSDDFCPDPDSWTPRRTAPVRRRPARPRRRPHKA